uniref:Uncharacterized protein LOC111099128 n=1 Tax=Crassostrea virginica TaxID=6565 RepID=A0A8B8A8N0_CRAVI|nr:uncharacterized protein LOC111099128 [Crassostrea virginica]
MANASFIVLLFSFLVSLYVFNVQSISKTCEYQGKNYTECDLMYWTGWNTCTGGHGMKPKECAVGMEKRQKAVCCPRNAINETQAETFRLCKINCKMTDDDFEEVRRLTTTAPPSTASIVRSSRPTTKAAAQTNVPKQTATVPQGGALHVRGNGTIENLSVDSGLSTEEIAGIAAAGAAALLGLCCTIFGLLYKRQKRKKEVEPKEKRNDVSASK